MSLNYRPEIDGLRALAILPVLLFHIGFSGFTGGFVGVDVFFVISGYLITLILLKEKSNGNFSIKGFYERRARRILPALLAVIAVCYILSYFWLTPSQMKEFGLSAISAIFFVSNVFFMKHSTYFDAASEEMPLLHTWSLAVEEQYYIIFPLFIMIAWRFGFRAMFSLILIACVTSLAISEYGWRNHNVANFFLIISRAWEILAGSLCAFVLFKRPQFKSNEALALLGIAMIVASVFFLNPQTPFPSLYTLLPVGGAVLVILFCSPHTLAGRVLALKPMVFIGLISYSLYLWHQPILAFYRIRVTDTFPLTHQLSILLATIVLAYASWRFIETPFRKSNHGKPLINGARIFRLSAFGILALSLFGSAIYATNGFPHREGVDRRKMSMAEHQIRYNYGLSEECRYFTLSESCNTSKDPEVLLWGDSFAMHLGDALLSAKEDIKLIQLTRFSCPPVMDFSILIPNEKGANECIEFNRKVMSVIEKTPSIRKVIISSKISYLLNKPALENGKLVSVGEKEIASHFLKTAKKLKATGREVLFVAPTPYDGRDLGRCVLRKQLFGGDVKDCSFRRSDYSDDTKHAFSITDAIKPYMNTLMLSDLICDQERCHSSVGDAPIYRDWGHLSYPGARIVGARSAALQEFLQ